MIENEGSKHKTAVNAYILHPVYRETGGGESNLKLSVYTLFLLQNHHHQHQQIVYNLFFGYYLCTSLCVSIQVYEIIEHF